MKRLVAIESPRIAVARPVPSTKEAASSPAASRIDFIMASAPRSMSPFMTKAATGWTWPLMTALVTPCSTRDSAAGEAATTMSQPSTRLAPPAAMRTACRSSGFGARRTWLITAPFFCARPVKSSTVQPLPSRWAAMPISAPTVITPVPPMPVTRMP